MNLKKKPLSKQAIVGICCGIVVGTLLVLAVLFVCIFVLHNKKMQDNLCMEFSDSDFYVAAAAQDNSGNGVVLLAERLRGNSWTIEDVDDMAAQLKTRKLDCIIQTKGQTYAYKDTLFYTDATVLDGYMVCYYGMYLQGVCDTNATLKLSRKQLEIDFAAEDATISTDFAGQFGSAKIAAFRAGRGFAAVQISLTSDTNMTLASPAIDVCTGQKNDKSNVNCNIIPVYSNQDSVFALCGIEQSYLPTESGFAQLAQLQVEEISLDVGLEAPLEYTVQNVADKDQSTVNLSQEHGILCESRVRKSNILSVVLARECAYGQIQNVNACLLPPGAVPSNLQMEQVFTGVTVNGQISVSTPYAQLYLYGVRVSCPVSGQWLKLK